MIQFEIPGPPVGKGRPRFARRGEFVKTYTPEKTASYESMVKMIAGQAMQSKSPFSFPCECTISVLITPPASWSKKKQSDALGGYVFPTTKPDLDNAAKLILDACNGIVFDDDKQVVTLTASKRYAHKNSVIVQIERADEGVVA